MRKFGIECDLVLDANTSRTKEAGAIKRDAMSQRRADANGLGWLPEDEVISMERTADDMIVRTVTWLSMPGGEVPGVSEQTGKARPVLPAGALQAIGMYTGQGDSRIAEDASLIRLELLNTRELDVAPMALDAANSIDATNSLEKMLAHQAATAHELAMRFSARAMHCRFPAQSVEASRYVITATRAMSSYQGALIALKHYRKGVMATGQRSQSELRVHFERPCNKDAPARYLRPNHEPE